MASALKGGQKDAESLHNLFPDLSRDALNEALDKAGGSVEIAAEVIQLTIMEIQH